MIRSSAKDVQKRGRDRRIVVVCLTGASVFEWHCAGMGTDNSLMSRHCRNSSNSILCPIARRVLSAYKLTCRHGLYSTCRRIKTFEACLINFIVHKVAGWFRKFLKISATVTKKVFFENIFFYWNLSWIFYPT